MINSDIVDARVIIGSSEAFSAMIADSINRRFWEQLQASRQSPLFGTARSQDPGSTTDAGPGPTINMILMRSGILPGSI